MNKTKIDWCDYTWNPAVGCLNDCSYCYARKITNRFKSIYPNGFKPTFYENRLDEPTKIKKPQNIFVCSMADLFGDWVSDEWIKKVFEVCEKTPQHRYLFLTKNPKRYDQYFETLKSNEFWYGATVTDNKSFDEAFHSISRGVNVNAFLSIEPLCERLDVELEDLKGYKLIIIGAETGNRKDKIIPKREWIEDIVNACKQGDIPVFMKSSLIDVWGEDLIQEKQF